MPVQPRHQRRQRRFVAVCQQVLALGVICAALTPATGVMSLDLVPEAPVGSLDQGAGSGGVQLTDRAAGSVASVLHRDARRALFGAAALGLPGGHARG